MGARLLAVAATLLTALVAAGAGVAGGDPSCTTIGSGLLADSAGNPLVEGYDAYGYNYQAHMFNGTYDSSDRVLDGTYWGSTGDWVDDHVMMKWSDDWLSNVDCNGDGKLDRGAAGVSMGWLTNHVVGDGYTDFVKIGWVGPGGDLWGQYTILQEVYNEPGGGSFRFKLASPGLGQNDHWTSLP